MHYPGVAAHPRGVLAPGTTSAGLPARRRGRQTRRARRAGTPRTRPARARPRPIADRHDQHAEPRPVEPADHPRGRDARHRRSPPSRPRRRSRTRSRRSSRADQPGRRNGDADGEPDSADGAWREPRLRPAHRAVPRRRRRRGGRASSELHFFCAALELAALLMFRPLVLKIGPLPEVFGAGSVTPFSRMQLANLASAFLKAGLLTRPKRPRCRSTTGERVSSALLDRRLETVPGVTPFGQATGAAPALRLVGIRLRSVGPLLPVCGWWVWAA